MPTRNAKAQWSGSLKNGKGTVATQSGVLDAAYSFPTRFEDASGTNPEELIAAAHAGCYAMAFSAVLGEEGYDPSQLDARADVTLAEVDGKPTITRVALKVSGKVEGLDAGEFKRIAEDAKNFCPVSRALTGVEITLDVDAA
ncbi:peroxiredoxin [Rhodovibrio sodomensis]|uniref:Peroxiredoxin n=1 Tax=Rhodovibrio sodomensis TaxID=1088 RepID=A0ABS1DBL6_9PROT|nr:OsmC family protein [Rhodovibrio sodomensis]MBK1667103.1 peroxiredoxin [Rhodovibrio sodomensis]